MEKKINYLNHNEIIKTYENIEKNILNQTEFKNELLLQLKNNIKNYPLNFNENINNENKIFILENKNYNNDFLFISYPQGNLLILIINNYLLCQKNNNFIFKFYPLNSFVSETTFSSIENLTKIIKSNNNEFNFNLLNNILTPRNILTLLGIRETTGSLNNYLPIDKNILINSFNNLHSPKSKLTVGARALTKHSHRSITDNFWPDQNGKEQEKNEKANKILEKILENCVWINIHGLPHNVAILEIRNEKGYGMRWEISNLFFRGFLEPQMENGHEKGWIH